MSLKHPFDATSMEGLLNKIVKSQPPPLPKQYSIELRTVVDSLLSKQPSKRPTVNSLLKLPFLAPYVQKLLSPAQMADEFSHTVLHSDASARSHAPSAVGPPIPPSNYVVAREKPLPPPTGIKPRPNIPTHPQSQREQQQPHPPHPSYQQHQQQQFHNQHQYQPHSAYPSSYPSSAGVDQPRDSGSRGGPSPSPYYGQPPASHRPVSSRQPPQSAAAAAAPTPPSPYAGLSNADKIRAIREKKEAELRAIKREQEELQRRRMQQQQQPPQPAHHQRQPSSHYEEKLNDVDSDRQRERELMKERQLAAAARGAEVHLPPSLRGRDPPLTRGIPSVNRNDVAATPLHGVPYNDRMGAANPTRLQHQQLAEQARRAREEEVTRMRIDYFKQRKVKRETKLKELSHAPQYSPYGQPQQQRQPVAHPHIPNGYPAHAQQRRPIMQPNMPPIQQRQQPTEPRWR